MRRGLSFTPDLTGLGAPLRSNQDCSVMYPGIVVVCGMPGRCVTPAMTGDCERANSNIEREGDQY